MSAVTDSSLPYLGGSPWVGDFLTWDPEAQLYTYEAFTTGGAFVFGTTGFGEEIVVLSGEFRAATPTSVGAVVQWQYAGKLFNEGPPLVLSQDWLPMSSRLITSDIVMGLRILSHASGQSSTHIELRNLEALILTFPPPHRMGRVA